MKCTLVFALAIIAFANAGSTNPEESTQEVACKDGGTATQMMWTTGAGSSTCTLSDVSGESVYYLGVCDNAAGTYAISAYSDSTCTTASTATASLAASATTLPATVSSTAVTSCGACPPSDSTDRTVTYIGAFFGAVLAYLLLVCFGMYVCFKLGMPCP